MGVLAEFILEHSPDVTTTRWYIPDSTLHWIERVPKDRPVAMLIRHSVRNQLPPGEMGVEMPITADGRR